ncbi:hypothetical protein NDU88_002113 [Pleurodeles waltl]|uniref:Uncharacterized protein n=1 Tax=Pleurodeles waltl TaxID=8319 RepID=A0AAV7T1F7_PLEWA|nr:hypothetical protein NDU88_002113 [Pleurodeles waltl]
MELSPARAKRGEYRQIESEHGYSSFKLQEAQDSDQSSDQSSAKISSDSESDSTRSEHPGPSKRKRSDKAKNTVTKAPRVLTFNPEDIVHPRSTSWAPPEVALYMQDHIRASFDKEVRARLRAECPRPDLDGKVTDTPDIDPAMVTFLKKWAKDPKKGLDRAWRSCQDKLLDLSGPLAKILELAYVLIRNNDVLDTRWTSEKFSTGFWFVVSLRSFGFPFWIRLL